jgi:hypothetical protein
VRDSTFPSDRSLVSANMEMPPRSPEYMAENIAPQLLAIEGTLFAIAMSAVFLRFYVRIFMLKIFGWDGKPKSKADQSINLTVPFIDWMILIAAVRYKRVAWNNLQPNILNIHLLSRP